MIKFADDTILVCTIEESTAPYAAISRDALVFKIPKSENTVESIKTILSDTAKTTTISVLDGETTTATYSNYTILVGGITLKTIDNEDYIIAVLAQETYAEIQVDTQAQEIITLKGQNAYMQSALAAIQLFTK
jgi:hypothetical protein